MAIRNNGFSLMELVVVLAVVAILALMAVPNFSEKIVRDQIIEALPLADIAKGPIAASWTVSKSFPPDNESAGLPAADKIVSNYVTSVQVRDGAIDITFGNRANGFINGKVLTLRAAVVDDAPIVPVTWVCGTAAAPDKMTMHGADNTNIPAKFLPLKCRQ